LGRRGVVGGGVQTTPKTNPASRQGGLCRDVPKVRNEKKDVNDDAAERKEKGDFLLKKAR